MFKLIPNSTKKPISKPNHKPARRTKFEPSRKIPKYLKESSLRSLRALSEARRVMTQQYLASDPDDVDDDRDHAAPASEAAYEMKSFSVIGNEITFENQSVALLTVPPGSLRDRVETALVNDDLVEMLLKDLADERFERKYLQDELDYLQAQENED